MKHELFTSKEKLVLKKSLLKEVGKEKWAKQSEKCCKHIKLGFSTSVFGAVSAINCID